MRARVVSVNTLPATAAATTLGYHCFRGVARERTTFIVHAEGDGERDDAVTRGGGLGAFYTVVPIRPRWRGERRSLRTLPGVSLRPPIAFNTRPRRLSRPTDAFRLHPDIRTYGMALSRRQLEDAREGLGRRGGGARERGRARDHERRRDVPGAPTASSAVHRADASDTRRGRGRARGEVRSISHWSPYDGVRVVNADP